MNVQVNDFDMPEVPSSRPSGGFRAHLQGVSLHDLIQVENLARSTGVFVVLSGDRVGYLHVLDGELIHAEGEGLTGEAAALEILSWSEGEFRNCERLLAQARTVRASLQGLLLRLAKASDEQRHVDSSLATTATRRKDGSLVKAVGAPGSVTQRVPVVSRAARLSADGESRAEVLLSERGELLDGRGYGYDELASQVAYTARLAELVAGSLGAGDARALEVRGKANEVLVRWLPNGNVLGLVRRPKGVEVDPRSSTGSVLEEAARAALEEHDGENPASRSVP